MGSSFNSTNSDELSWDIGQTHEETDQVSIKTNSSCLSNETEFKTNKVRHKSFAFNSETSFTRIISNHLSSSTAKIYNQLESHELDLKKLIISNDSARKPLVKRSSSLKSDLERQFINLFNKSKRLLRPEFVNSNQIKDEQKMDDANNDASSLGQNNQENIPRLTSKFIPKLNSYNNETFSVNKQNYKAQEPKYERKSFDFLPSKLVLIKSNQQSNSTLKKDDQSFNEQDVSSFQAKSTTFLVSTTSASCINHQTDPNKSNHVPLQHKRQIHPNNRASVDANTLNMIKKLDDNNNNQNSKNGNSNVIVNDLNLAGVTWSVPNIRKQFERSVSQNENQHIQQRVSLSGPSDTNEKSNNNSLRRLSRVSTIEKSNGPIRSSQIKIEPNMFQSNKDLNDISENYI